MKSESDASDYITEFVSGGTTSYGYVTKQGKTCCKVRRFTLNYRESPHHGAKCVGRDSVTPGREAYHTNSESMFLCA